MDKDTPVTNPKVLMVGLNSSWSQSTPALYYLRQMIVDLPYRVEIMELTLKDFPLDILRQIVKAAPDILCFSAYIWNRTLLQTIIPSCRKLLPRALIVIGGPEATRITMQNKDKLFVISGPGEAAFLALAKHEFKRLPPYENLPLNAIPFPYIREDKSQLQGKLVYYEAYRGCPYHCAYCLSALDVRNEARFDLNKAEDLQRLNCELDMLMALQPKTLKFIDRSFNTQKALAHHIWKHLIDHNWPCDAHFEIYPELLDEEDYRILEQAPENRIRFEIGVQTTNDAIARACGRNSSWKKVRSALIELKKRTKVRIHADLLSGLPGQNLESVITSLNELAQTLPDAIQLGMLKILPDTPMEAIAHARGYHWEEEPPYQTLSSDALLSDDLWILDDYAHLLALYWNKEEFKAQWADMLSRHCLRYILNELIMIHEMHGFPLHSISKEKRKSVMQTLEITLEL